MKFFSDLSAPSTIALLVIINLSTIFFIWRMGTKLADINGSDVRIVWYIFSLSSVCTVIAACWASSVGAIDPSGEFQGSLGKSIELLLKFMLDLDTDIKLFSALFAVFVIPQITSYLLSGLFGCASSPILIGKALGFFVWGIVKSIVVISGILSTLAIYGAAKGWVEWDIKGFGSLSFSSLMLLALSFFCLYIYKDIDRDIDSTVELPVSHRGQRIQRCLISMRNWLTRKNRKKATSTEA